MRALQNNYFFTIALTKSSLELFVKKNVAGFHQFLCSFIDNFSDWTH